MPAATACPSTRTLEGMATLDPGKALLKSLSKPSSTPDYGAPDRESFLEEQREKLKSLIVTPITVTAHPSKWAKEHGEFQDDIYEMFAVAGEGENWLLYDPGTEAFSLAKGKLGSNMELIGFRSKDALAEWNG